MAFPIGAVPGIDVSHYQGVIDWPTVAAGGEAFAFAKASEGGSVADAYFADNWSALKGAGILRGAYHFYHPATDADSQATYFLDRLANANGGSTQLAPGDLPVALDLEVTDGVAPADVLSGVARGCGARNWPKTDCLYVRRLLEEHSRQSIGFVGISALDFPPECYVSDDSWRLDELDLLAIRKTADQWNMHGPHRRGRG